MYLPDSVPGHFVQPIDYWATPRLAAGTQPMGFLPWSRGPLLHRGGEGVALTFGRPRGSIGLPDFVHVGISCSARRTQP